MKLTKIGNLTAFGNDLLVNLDEVRVIDGRSILFKNDAQKYGVDQESADAIRDAIKQVRQARGEPQPENPDKGPARPSSDLPLRSKASASKKERSS